ncbi:GatB/YqeY domain-containing protein [Roseiflexus sp.]|uniref:GatB/YqeY domain-containing protein n=1 Tax=Roseiflexus sp. TaxID=2562120 RepID=UPI0021DC26A7|nr:GatB/YqeY domain-containing protein [Roseiflexus sp.]GIV98683.1 MAG: aspartyl-tRNA amidotransferase subunit B [Roseiflexus sp.]
MAILEQLQNDLKAALKSGDRLRVETIRMAIDALKKAQMAQVKAAFDAAGGESADTAALAEIDRHAILTEAAEHEVLTKEVKRRREAAELYRKGGRTDLAEKEEAEAAILQAYLPQQLSEEELRPLVKAIIDEIGAAGPADMGRVMPVLMQRLKGRADGRLISQMARDLLSHAP